MVPKISREASENLATWQSRPGGKVRQLRWLPSPGEEQRHCYPNDVSDDCADDDADCHVIHRATRLARQHGGVRPR